jgi:predicted PurR-regulated permease PerM
MGGRQDIAATMLVLLGILLIVVPTAVLMNSLGDSVHQLIDKVQTNSLIAADEMFRGTLTQTSVYPREWSRRRSSTMQRR